MPKKERLNKLLELLVAGNNYSVNDLSIMLGVSEPTIRRDLIYLEERNKITRLWGGAVAKYGDQSISDYNLMKFSINKEKKIDICKRAAKLIKDNYVVYIDAGSTCAYIPDFIDASNLFVVTNGFTIISALAKKNIKTYVLGGFVIPESASIQGAEAIRTIRNHNFDVCFLGSTGIHEKAGYTTASYDDYSLKAEIIKKSEQAYICCDSSKIGIKKGYSFAYFDDALLITDSENITEEQRRYIKLLD